MSVIALAIGRTASAFTSENYTMFLVASFFGSATSSSVFNGPLVVAMEISKSEHKARIAMFQNMGWSFGSCLMPLVMWYVGHWVPFILLTTLPCVLFLLPYRSVSFLLFFKTFIVMYGVETANIPEEKFVRFTASHAVRVLRNYLYLNTLGITLMVF